MKKSIRTEIIINASKEKVWQVLTDLDSYSKWNPFIVQASGEIKQGERITNTMLNGNKKMVFKPKILSVVPYQYFDWLGSLWFRGIFDGHHYFEIEPVSATQVKLNHGEYFDGILSAYILKKIGNDTRNSFIKMNDAIKAMAENNQIINAKKHHTL